MVALEIESWIWYAFVMLVALSRLISRRMTLGSIKRFQSDDYIMLLILCFYTTLVATINIVRYTSSNLLPPGFDVNTLSPEDIRERAYGSKLILVVEQCSCCTIWGAKACLLILYLRLTTLRWENIGIKVLAGYVTFGFVFMEIFYFGVWCRPFYQYWQVPTSNVQCDAATNHLITNAVFNLSSDCIMLAIGLPMFLRLQLPWKKKVPVVGIFSLGVFVMLAAILNKVYSFTEPFGAMWTYWYVRESSTALLVANLPFVWTFWRKMSGTKTVNGISRQGSKSAEAVMNRREEREVERSDNALTSPWQVYTARSSTENDLELGGAPYRTTSGGFTLDEMLSDPNPASANGKEPTPYTHPQLFFSESLRHGYMQKAMLGNRSELELVRGDSEFDSGAQGTPVSSLFPRSLNSRKSAGSFL